MICLYIEIENNPEIIESKDKFEIMMVEYLMLSK